MHFILPAGYQSGITSEELGYARNEDNLVCLLLCPFHFQRHYIRSQSHRSPLMLVTSSPDLCPERLCGLEYVLVSLATQELSPSASTAVYSTDVLRTNRFLNGCNLLGAVCEHLLYVFGVSAKHS